MKYARKAVQQQGAEMVLFQFDGMDESIYIELLKLKRQGIHGKYFVTEEDRIETF